MNIEEVEQTVILFEANNMPRSTASYQKDQITPHNKAVTEISTEGTRHHLLYYKPSTRIPPKQIPQFMQEGLQAYQKMFGGRIL